MCGTTVGAPQDRDESTNITEYFWFFATFAGWSITAIGSSPRTSLSAPMASSSPRREILDAAGEFLQTRSYRDLKVGELMERTTIGRSAFYAYFNDVSELVEALIDEVEGEVIASMQAWGEETREPRTGLRALLSGTVNLWILKGPMLSGLFDAAAGDQRLQTAIRRVLAHYEDVIATILQREMAAGRTRSIDCDEMATALVEGSQAYLKERLGHNGPKDPLKVLATLETMWIHTIYPD